MPVQVELSNPGEDAKEMEAVLSAAGLLVHHVSLAELGRLGEASVVDVSQPGAERAIDALLSRRDQPIVRIGVERASPAALPRPVGHDALLVAVRQALSGSRPRQRGYPAIDDATQDVHRTHEPGIELATQVQNVVPFELEAQRARPSTSLSEALRRAGGELLFEHLERGQGDGASRLAPDALFEVALTAGAGLGDEHELSVLERTLPDLVDSVDPLMSDAPISAPPETEANLGEGWLRLDDSTLGVADATGSFRTGTTAPLGMVRLLWRVAELGLDLELDASFGAERVVVRFVAGGVRELRGACHKRLLASLEPSPQVDDESEAEARVEAARNAGEITRFDIDRRLRLAREGMLVDLALSDAASFTLRGLSAKEARRLSETAAPLARPALSLVLQGARERLEEDALARLAGGARRMRLLPDARARLQQAEVEPELRATLLRNDGGSYQDVLEELGEATGGAGLLCILAVLDAVRFVSDSDAPG